MFTSYHVGQITTACQVSSFFEAVWIDFQFQDHSIKKQFIWCIKFAKWSQKCLNFRILVWMLSVEHVKSLGFKGFIKIGMSSWSGDRREKYTIVCAIVLSQTDIIVYPNEMIQETFRRWVASYVLDDHKRFCIINCV